LIRSTSIVARPAAVRPWSTGPSYEKCALQTAARGLKRAWQAFSGRQTRKNVHGTENMLAADYVIVGSGLTGAVIARALVDAGREADILERRWVKGVGRVGSRFGLAADVTVYLERRSLTGKSLLRYADQIGIVGGQGGCHEPERT